MRRRVLGGIFAAVIAATALLSLFAQPASAQRVWPLIGCDSYLNWPCPGPVLVDP